MVFLGAVDYQALKIECIKRDQVGVCVYMSAEWSSIVTHDKCQQLHHVHVCATTILRCNNVRMYTCNYCYHLIVCCIHDYCIIV